MNFHKDCGRMENLRTSGKSSGILYISFQFHTRLQKKKTENYKNLETGWNQTRSCYKYKETNVANTINAWGKHEGKQEGRRAGRRAVWGICKEPSPAVLLYHLLEARLADPFFLKEINWLDFQVTMTSQLIHLLRIAFHDRISTSYMRALLKMEYFLHD